MISSKFFKPDSMLLDSLAEYLKGRKVIEVGSGNGDILKELHNRGITGIAGIDPHPHERLIHINGTIINVLNVRIEEVPAIMKNNEGVFLICRPCHSGFVQYCIENKHKKCELIYIGLEKNFEIDGIINTEYTVLDLKGTSEDNEVIISIK